MPFQAVHGGIGLCLRENVLQASGSADDMEATMASGTMRGTTGVDRAEGKGLGLVIFAAVLLLVVGSFNLIDGIAAISKSHVFTANATYVIGDLRAWGWVVLIFGVLQILAGGGVMVGNQVARWVGVMLIACNTIAQLFFIPAYPFWSLLIISVDVVALYALCLYGSREDVAGA
jgi:hypothetical protein